MPQQIKQRSEARILALGGTVNANLPFIEPIEEISPKSAPVVAARAHALSYVCGIGYDADSDSLMANLRSFDLLSAVTAQERSLLEGEASEQDKINCQWLAESIYALAYCLELVDGLDPTGPASGDLMEHFPYAADPTSKITSAHLRPIEEIQQQVDLHYRMHWHTKNCTMRQIDPAPLDNSVIRMRRHALDWAFGIADDWDEISLDT